MFAQFFRIRVHERKLVSRCGTHLSYLGLDVAPLQKRVATGNRLISRQHTERRRLAGAVVAKETKALPAFHA